MRQNDEQKAARPKVPSANEDSSEALLNARVTLEEGGRIVIPAAMRYALGVAEGDELQLVLEEDRIVAWPRKAVVRHLQSFFARARDPERSVVDEFIVERRAMWGEG